MQSKGKSYSDAIGSQHSEMTFQWLCETGSTLCSSEWICYSNEDYICFGILAIKAGQVFVRLSVSVSKILQVQVFNNGRKSTLPSISKSQVKTCGDITEILDQVKRRGRKRSSVRNEHQENSTAVDVEQLSKREFEEVKLEMLPTTWCESNVFAEEEENLNKSYDHQDFSFTVVKSELNSDDLDSIPTQTLYGNEIDDYDASTEDEQYVFSDAVIDLSSKTKSCSNTYVDDYNLEHTSGNENVKCNVCKRILESNASLTAHMMLVHSGKMFHTLIEGATPFKCKACDKRYAHKNDLHKHYRAHHMTKELQCKYCWKRFALKKELKGHIARHENKDCFQCKVCGKAFKAKSVLKRHMKNIHLSETKPNLSNERPYVCCICNKSYPCYQYLKSHLSCHSRNKTNFTSSNQCDICGRTLESETSLAAHKKLVHSGEIFHTIIEGPTPIKCRECNRSFKCMSEFNKHYRCCHLKKELKYDEAGSADVFSDAATDLPSKIKSCSIADNDYDDAEKLSGRTVKCDLCERHVESIASLTAHKMLIHSGETFHTMIEGSTPFKCKMCDKSYKCKPYLHRHYRVCHMKKELKCTYCEKYFAYKQDKNMHMSVHKDKYYFQCDEYVCYICHKAFSCSNCLKTHLSRHWGSKNTATSVSRCHLCRIAIAGLDGPLAAHKLLIHSGEEIVTLVKCTKCDKSYPRMSELKKHYRVHHMTKEIICIYCDKLFALNSHLKSHMATHEDKFPYQCDVCGKAFKLSSRLCKHLLVHETEHRFSCQICGKGFRRKREMIDHATYVHSNERSFLCDQCSKSYKLARDLQKHVSKCHLVNKTA